MSCNGCESCRVQDWTRGEVAFRCFDKYAGYFYGRVLDIIKKGYEKDLEVQAPAWCPKEETK